MSRCFPFPPPGYEKKIRTEDSLVKEKQKKHRKEKKDKEKRDGKQKKDKEGSRDIYKEGKERKEKHRDRKDKEKNRTSQEDKNTVGAHPNNTVQNNGNEESKFVQDLARRINDEEEARESQSLGKSSSPCEVTENFAIEKRSEPVEKKEHAKKTELQEKNHLRESVTKAEPKYTTHRSNQENKEEKTEPINKSKHKYIEEGGSMLKERDVDTRNIGKRKDHETNGFCYENGTRPNKIHRPVASPVSSVENGSKLGACQTPPKPVTELQVTVCNPEVKEHRGNGFAYAQEPKRPPRITSVEVKENGEALAKKRPHSDLKYFDQILNLEELHEFDESEEQEWLFGQSGVKLSKKQKKDSTTSLDETLQVWNQALRIESADTVALPYVVPF
ncbi:hypothetical protein HA466_0276480 [Hirschfeldia incana]|nr:hypothetical protein HA466_0276480 [Hirschfeldia incana]